MPGYTRGAVRQHGQTLVLSKSDTFCFDATSNTILGFDVVERFLLVVDAVDWSVFHVYIDSVCLK